jgi:hypothetical protein
LQDLLSVLKWSEGLSKRESVIIRRHINHTNFYCFFCIVLVLLCNHFIYGCKFCILLFNFVYYVFLLLCLRILIVMYFLGIVLFCVLFICKCVLYYRHRVSTQLQLTNKSISFYRREYTKINLKAMRWENFK